jgi:hypothetical protein
VDLLSQYGVNYAQGYRIGKPRPLAELYSHRCEANGDANMNLCHARRSGRSRAPGSIGRGARRLGVEDAHATVCESRDAAGRSPAARLDCDVDPASLAERERTDREFLQRSDFLKSRAAPRVEAGMASTTSTTIGCGRMSPSCRLRTVTRSRSSLREV